MKNQRQDDKKMQPDLIHATCYMIGCQRATLTDQRSPCQQVRERMLVQEASLDSQPLVLVFGLLKAILIDINDSSITKQIVITLSPSPVSQHHFEIISLKLLELADGLTKRPITEQMETGERCFPLTPDGEQVWAPVISQSTRTLWTHLKRIFW